MTDYADLEIGLHRWDANSFSVDLRYSEPRSDADVRPLVSGPIVRFDLDQLRMHSHDPVGYGKVLSGYLFGNPAVSSAFAQARTAARTLGIPLRLRLFISPGAAELHKLHWETLLDPQDGFNSPLLTINDLYFSRYSISSDWRPVRPLARGSLTALVAIADPNSIEAWRPAGRKLARLDVPGEIGRAVKGLRGIEVTLLAPQGTPDMRGTATLRGLVDGLREGCDIVYLVCHGAIERGEPRLWLEDPDGGVDVVFGTELVQQMRELRQQPRLLVLASCQSAGTGMEARSDDDGALAALGPRLAEAGIPAILAMQGNITMKTVAEFLPIFFRELQQDGQIDRSMTVARGVVRDRPDHWMPVLFMRLKTGQLWFQEGTDIGGVGSTFLKWEALLNNIQARECTPILGSGLYESLLGSTREIARRWADTYRFPMAPHDREDLPQVAQFLAQTQDEPFPRRELTNYLRREIRRRYGEILRASPRWRSLDDLRKATLDAIITEVGAYRRKTELKDPYAMLAALPFPVYLTTTPESLLTDALREEGKSPDVGIFDWKSEVEDSHDPAIQRDPDDRSDERRPLVYHLFGHLRKSHSLVLTEDDYFDYLIAVTQRKKLIPPIIGGVLANTALLFLGFRIDDWDFRVFFRSLMGQEGAEFRRRKVRFAHVAVQIDPEGGQVLEPELARRYLERYFQDAQISIYWGKVEDFLGELHQRWTERRNREDF